MFLLYMVVLGWLMGGHTSIHFGVILTPVAETDPWMVVQVHVRAVGTRLGESKVRNPEKVRKPLTLV